MRIIDSDAINKRVFADIANTFQHSSKITGEKTVQDFSGTDDPKAAVVDNFNFNGIEFSKIKQMINYIQTHKKQFKFDRKLVELTNNKQTDLKYFVKETQEESGDDTITIQTTIEQAGDYGVVVSGVRKEFLVDDLFDGRNSFIYPRFVVVYLNAGAVGTECKIRQAYLTDIDPYDCIYCEEKDTLNQSTCRFEFYKPNLYKSTHFGLTSKKVLLDGHEFIRCWAAGISNSNGSNALIVDKKKHEIITTSSLYLAHKNFGFDRNAWHKLERLNSAKLLNQNWIARVYLDIFFMYWRDK